jgi:ribonuclease Y
VSVGIYVLVALVAIAIGFFVGQAQAQKARPIREQTTSDDLDRALAEAREQAEALRRKAEVDAKEILFNARSEVEREAGGRRAELFAQEQALKQRETSSERKLQELTGKEEQIGRQERQIGQREQAAEAAARQAQQLLEDAKARLEKLAGLTAEQARQKLAEQMAEDAKKQAAAEIRRIEMEAQEEAAGRSRKILGVAIQRYAGEYVAERTVAVVPLPSDDLKGRIIGREGRNIRALEAALGIDIIIDDTPEAITISCFNPVRREIAKLALTKLIADGRIHPTRIEEIVGKVTDEVDAVSKEVGEQAVFDLGLHKVHPDLVRLLGSLRFRSSYAQNLLAHSIEVGFLAGLMAGELGQNVKQARRAGLLHDIGKGVDHELEGSHAQVGAQVAKKYGEHPRIVHAIEAHHREVPQESILDHIVDAANLLSGQRPGARRELLESYVQRLDKLEKIATSYPGVERAYAIQAGREVRVLVDNATLTDEQASMLSRDIARRIENELAYPGTIRVAVVRETRATDYAR